MSITLAVFFIIWAASNAEANTMLWDRMMYQRLEGNGLRSVAESREDISQAHCTMLCLIMNNPKCLATAYYADKRECQLSLEPAVLRSYAAGSRIPVIYQNMGFGKLNNFYVSNIESLFVYHTFSLSHFHNTSLSLLV